MASFVKAGHWRLRLTTKVLISTENVLQPVSGAGPSCKDEQVVHGLRAGRRISYLVISHSIASYFSRIS